MLIGRFLFICRCSPRPAAWPRRSACRSPAAPCRRTAALFVGLLVGTVIIVGALTFFPALVARPDRRAFPDASGTAVLDGRAVLDVELAMATTDRCPPTARRAVRRTRRPTTSLLPTKLARARPLFDPEIVARAHRGVVRQAEPGDAAEEPGDVRGRGRRGAHDALPGAATSSTGAAASRFERADRPLALVHGAVRQLRRSDGRRRAARRRPTRCARPRPTRIAKR